MKTKLYRMTEADWQLIKVAAATNSDWAVNAAISRVREARPRVKIEVLGGVAEVTRCSPGVDVTVKDHDNDECEE